MNLKILINTSINSVLFSEKNHQKRKKTITLTKNNKRPIFILHKKTTSDVNLANNFIQISYAKFMILSY